MNRAMWGELSEDPALRARVRERIVEQVRLSLSAL